jgi:hypothetical protein
MIHLNARLWTATLKETMNWGGGAKDLFNRALAAIKRKILSKGEKKTEEEK